MTTTRTPRRAPGDLSATLRALADPTRLRILLMLEGKRRTVGEIVDFFALSQPTISRHLQTLTAAGLVERRREAQKVYYATHAVNVGALCISLADSFPGCCVTVKQATPKPRSGPGTSRSTRTRKPGGRRKTPKRPKA